MFASGIALMIDALAVVVALVGIAVIGAGIIARRRGAGGLALLVIGAVIALLPVGVIASSYLPGHG